MGNRRKKNFLKTTFRNKISFTVNLFLHLTLFLSLFDVDDQSGSLNILEKLLPEVKRLDDKALLVEIEVSFLFFNIFF
jgi:hypothetical protein